MNMIPFKNYIYNYHTKLVCIIINLKYIKRMRKIKSIQVFLFISGTKIINVDDVIIYASLVSKKLNLRFRRICA